MAAEAGHFECTELLLGAGVSREAMATALLCAERKGRAECAALLRHALQQDVEQDLEQGDHVEPDVERDVHVEHDVEQDGTQDVETI